jgi:hypothetical protein
LQVSKPRALRSGCRDGEGFEEVKVVDGWVSFGVRIREGDCKRQAAELDAEWMRRQMVGNSAHACGLREGNDSARWCKGEETETMFGRMWAVVICRGCIRIDGESEQGNRREILGGG